MLRYSLIGIAILIPSSIACACPFCDGDAGGNPVYDVIFGPDFWWNVVAMALPFGIFFALTILLHFGAPAVLRRWLSWNRV